MAEIPLPKGLSSIPDFPQLKESIINMISTEQGLMSRPGVENVTQALAGCRISFKFKGLHYQVSGPSLVRINKDTSVDVIGTIAGSEECEVAIDHVFAAIVVKGGAGYTFDGTTLLPIASPQYQASIDVAVVDGIFVYVPEDGGPVFFSEVGAPGNILPSSLFDAEILPDINTGVVNFKNDLYILGGEATEIFRHQGPSASAPFLRVNNGTVLTGLVAGKTKFRDTFVFLGKDKDDSYGVFAMGQGAATRISNNSVDTIIADEYTEDELRETIAQGFQWRGVDVAMFFLKRHTLAYFGEWAVFEGRVDGPDKHDPWSVKYITFVYGKYYTGSNDANVGRLSDIRTDNGEDIERGFDTFALAERGEHFRVSHLELDTLTGRGSTEYNLSLSLSRDGESYGPVLWTSLGGEGDYRQRVEFRYPGGLGSFESFMGVRVRCSDQVEFSPIALYG